MLSHPKGSSGTDRVLDAHQLAALLHKSVATIWKDLSRSPSSLPPCIRLPGKRGALWLESTVIAWLREFEDIGSDAVLWPGPTDSKEPAKRPVGRPRKVRRSERSDPSRERL